MATAVKRRSRDELTELVLDLLPQQGDWSEEAYLWLTDNTNRLVELTDGYIELLPMPTDKHQAILAFLFLALRGFVEPRGGKVRFAALRLRLRERRFREPDILLLLDAKDRRRQNRFWLGADLTVEVVSDDDPDRDLVRKRRDYAQAGILEYWVVNPLNQTIVVYRLQGKRYVRHGRFRRGQQATSPLLAGFTVDVAEVFDAD